MKFFSYIKRHSIFFSIAAFLLLVVVSFSLKVKQSKAIIPFGGPILSVTMCPCSANLAITVGAPNGGIFTFEPGVTMIKPFYQLFRPGPWVLGNYTPGSTGCWMFFVDGCFPLLTPVGTINEVGTSM